MSDTFRPTSNIRSAVHSQNVSDVVQSTSDDKTRSATTFIGDRRYVVSASHGDAPAGNLRLDPFAQAFEDARGEGFSFGARDVRLHGAAGEQQADRQGIPVSRETKSDGAVSLESPADETDAIALHDIAALNAAYERPVEGEILEGLVRQLTLPDDAKRTALDFIKQSIGGLRDPAAMAKILGKIRATGTASAAAADADPSRAAAMLRAALLNDSPLHDDTQTIIRTILGKSAHLQAINEDEHFRNLNHAIATHQVTERRDSPASTRTRDQALINVLTRLDSIPNNLRADLYAHFKP